MAQIGMKFFAQSDKYIEKCATYYYRRFTTLQLIFQLPTKTAMLSLFQCIASQSHACINTETIEREGWMIRHYEHVFCCCSCFSFFVCSDYSLHVDAKWCQIIGFCFVAFYKIKTKNQTDFYSPKINLMRTLLTWRHQSRPILPNFGNTVNFFSSTVLRTPKKREPTLLLPSHILTWAAD